AAHESAVANSRGSEVLSLVREKSRTRFSEGCSDSFGFLQRPALAIYFPKQGQNPPDLFQDSIRPAEKSSCGLLNILVYNLAGNVPPRCVRPSQVAGCWATDAARAVVRTRNTR